MSRPLYEFYDTRTGERVSTSVALSPEYAQKTIDEWVERDKRGVRQDIHDLIPFISYRQVEPKEGQ